MILATVWLLPPVAAVLLITLVSALGAAEVAGLARVAGFPVPASFVATASAIVSAAFALPGWALSPIADSLAIVLATLIVGTGAVSLAVWAPAKGVVAGAAVMTMAPVYVGLPLGVMAWVQTTTGPAVLTWLIAIIAVSDTAQYYSGRAFGRTKLAPSVSPAKTVEGLAGGLVVVALVGGWSGTVALPGLSPVMSGVLAVMLALAGVVGDLFESLLKRSAGVKDSSTLIPGHGGVLDRIDSHLFAAPVFLLFMRLVA